MSIAQPTLPTGAAAPPKAVADGHEGVVTGVPAVAAGRYGSGGGHSLERAIKVGISVTVAGAGLYGLISQQHFITSNAAVVTAYVTAVRSPIDGEVHGLPTSAGGWMPANGLLARVENPRANQERLDDLHREVDDAESAARGAANERSMLLASRMQMLTRTRMHIQTISARLASQAAEQSETLAAGEATAEQARATLRRARTLFAEGIISAAAFEVSATAEQVAERRVTADRMALQRIGLEEDAARQGVLAEPGVNNDVAYSQQRADEIDLRLAENGRSLAIATAQVTEGKRDLASQATHTALMHSAELRAPADSMLWRLDASNGEHLAVGDPVAEVVHCDDGLLLAAVPQNRVPDVLTGGRARIRLSGESFERPGIVEAVSADPLEGDNRKLAALPIKNSEERMATVRIRMLAKQGSSGETQACNVGRTATVIMPSTGSSMLVRWIRLYF